jgi:hypothetical protein
LLNGERTDLSTAYELGVYADNALRIGDIAKARQLMSAAADLDAGYAIRAAHIGEEDTRRITVTSTVARVIIRPLVAAGCRIRPPGKWAEGSSLERTDQPWTVTMLLSRDKFGGALGVNAARWTNPQHVEYYAFGAVKLPQAQIRYSTQRELEKACEQWREILLSVVLPWGAGVIDRAG